MWFVCLMSHLISTVSNFACLIFLEIDETFAMCVLDMWHWISTASNLAERHANLLSLRIVQCRGVGIAHHCIGIPCASRMLLSARTMPYHVFWKTVVGQIVHAQALTLLFARIKHGEAAQDGVKVTCPPLRAFVPIVPAWHKLKTYLKWVGPRKTISFALAPHVARNGQKVHHSVLDLRGPKSRASLSTNVETQDKWLLEATELADYFHVPLGQKAGLPDVHPKAFQLGT